MLTVYDHIEIGRVLWGTVMFLCCVGTFWTMAHHVD
jgi:hypothetical protein